ILENIGKPEDIPEITRRLFADAGKKGETTVTTLLAGRGIDITPEQVVLDAGGMREFLFGHTDSARGDIQGVRRVGRNAKPGEASFEIVPDEELHRLFAEPASYAQVQLGYAEAVKMRAEKGIAAAKAPLAAAKQSVRDLVKQAQANAERYHRRLLESALKPSQRSLLRIWNTMNELKGSTDWHVAVDANGRLTIMDGRLGTLVPAALSGAVPVQWTNSKGDACFGSCTVVRSDENSAELHTAAHVVKEAGENSITVIVGDRAIPARLLHTDPGSDQALLGIRATGLTLPAVPLAESVGTGQQVMVISFPSEEGSPRGYFDTKDMPVVTTAWVVPAGNGRTLTTHDGQRLTLTGELFGLKNARWLRPGSSGGMVLNLDGELLGMFIGENRDTVGEGGVIAGQHHGEGVFVPIDRIAAFLDLHYPTVAKVRSLLDQGETDKALTVLAQLAGDAQQIAAQATSADQQRVAAQLAAKAEAAIALLRGGNGSTAPELAELLDELQVLHDELDEILDAAGDTVDEGQPAAQTPAAERLAALAHQAGVSEPEADMLLTVLELLAQGSIPTASESDRAAFWVDRLAEQLPNTFTPAQRQAILDWYSAGNHGAQSAAEEAIKALDPLVRQALAAVTRATGSGTAIDERGTTNEEFLELIRSHPELGIRLSRRQQLLAKLFPKVEVPGTYRSASGADVVALRTALAPLIAELSAAGRSVDLGDLGRLIASRLGRVPSDGQLAVLVPGLARLINIIGELSKEDFPYAAVLNNAQAGRVVDLGNETNSTGPAPSKRPSGPTNGSTAGLEPAAEGERGRSGHAGAVGASSLANRRHVDVGRRTTTSTLRGHDQESPDPSESSGTSPPLSTGTTPNGAAGSAGSDRPITVRRQRLAAGVLLGGLAVTAIATFGFHLPMDLAIVAVYGAVLLAHLVRKGGRGSLAALRQLPGKVRQRPLTSAFIAVNALVFAATTPLVGGLLGMPSALFQHLALSPSAYLHGAWWQPLTAGFVHLGLGHLLTNTVALWIIGKEAEQTLGKARFLGVYLGSMLAGSLAAAVLFPAVGVVAGASGAIFGLMGGLMVAQRLRGGKVDPSLRLRIALNLGATFVLPGLSWQGHLGGLLGGALIAAIPGKRQAKSEPTDPAANAERDPADGVEEARPAKSPPGRHIGSRTVATAAVVGLALAGIGAVLAAHLGVSVPTVGGAGTTAAMVVGGFRARTSAPSERKRA
ncbi:MAG: rhomboid family intramembrane serine protease, partial [Sciscionella sp.]